jgi:hypothetical protein
MKGPSPELVAVLTSPIERKLPALIIVCDYP